LPLLPRGAKKGEGFFLSFFSTASLSVIERGSRSRPPRRPCRRRPSSGRAICAHASEKGGERGGGERVRVCARLRKLARAALSIKNRAIKSSPAEFFPLFRRSEGTKKEPNLWREGHRTKRGASPPRSAAGASRRCPPSSTSSPCCGRRACNRHCGLNCLLFGRALSSSEGDSPPPRPCSPPSSPRTGGGQWESSAGAQRGAAASFAASGGSRQTETPAAKVCVCVCIAASTSSSTSIPFTLPRAGGNARGSTRARTRTRACAGGKRQLLFSLLLPLFLSKKSVFSL